VGEYLIYPKGCPIKTYEGYYVTYIKKFDVLKQGSAQGNKVHILKNINIIGKKKEGGIGITNKKLAIGLIKGCGRWGGDIGSKTYETGS